MRKLYIAILFLIFTNTKSFSQITGDTAVCAGNFYTYSANILNADSFYWTTPAGWYNMQGQGTSQITVNCNSSAGDICVEGFDSLGVSLGVMCLTTIWGGGGQGFNVQPNTMTCCFDNTQTGSFQTSSVNLVPNGNSGNCGPCGGVINNHIIYGVYMGNTFMGVPNNFWLPNCICTVTYLVILVDTILGKNFPQAVAIQNGCGGASNNSISITGINNAPVYLSSLFYPQNVCVGATIVPGIEVDNMIPSFGCHVVISNPLTLMVDSINFGFLISGTNYNGCPFDFTNTNFIFGGTAIYCNSDLVGDSIVCAGKKYSYNATIPSGYTLTWQFPPGWYDISGQNTLQATATCNSNDGDVCIYIRDSHNYPFDTLGITTHFGDGSSQGWNVSPNTTFSCDSIITSFTAQVISNGTGGGGNCPVGCGNGAQQPNIVYAVYDSIWPNGNFVGVADGVSPIPFFAGSVPYYVYEVDTTNGVNSPQAILISGGCNVGTKNNIITHDTIAPLPSLTFNPATVCLDSLITINSNDSLINPQWTVSGGTIISNNGNSILVQATSMQLSVSVSGVDSVSTCALNGTFNVPVNYCAPVSLLGDQTVCAGYTYTYNISMPHAVTYNWTLPAGWYDVTGQNTSQITATANSNAGMISVTGFDSTGYALDSVSINTGFNLCHHKTVTPSTFKTCKNDSLKATVNDGNWGSGICGFTCGNGTQHANIAYAVYDDVFPNGTFRGFADSIQNISPLTATGNLYVYQVDYTNGTDAANAILISGECGGCNFANVISIDTTALTTSISKTPAIACVGDTITLTENNNALNPYWDNAVDLNLLSQNVNPVTAIVTGVNPAVDFTGMDSLTGCLVLKTKSITLPQQCFYPVASFSSSKTAFCEKQYVDFFDNTTNSPTSWNWTFYWGSPSTSTLQNPDSIYYNQYGSFNVKLIACNGLSCDTLMLTNYITVYPSPPIPVITGNSGIMYSSPAIGYAWYSTSNPTVILSTDSFYVPTQLGDYFVIITDSNGCNSASTTFSITGLQQTIFENEFTLTETSQNVFELILKYNFNDASIMLTDAQGKIMLNKKAEPINHFDLSSFSKGVYLLTLKSGNKIYTRKLMVM